MPHLPSLPERSKLMDVFKAYPATSKPLLEYHEALMRGPSPFSAGERELIATYVSGLNGCSYCKGVHGATAVALGIDRQALENLDGHSVDPKLRPILSYVRKLTETPDGITPADAQAVFDAGWSEQALHDAVSVCAIYNCMNRLVEGLGIKADATYFTAAGERLSKDGYAPMITMLGL